MLRGFQRGHNWAPLMPRGAILSGHSTQICCRNDSQAFPASEIQTPWHKWREIYWINRRLLGRHCCTTSGVLNPFLPTVPPLCQETSVSRTANVGTVGKNGLIKRSCNQCLDRPGTFVSSCSLFFQSLYVRGTALSCDGTNFNLFVFNLIFIFF